MVVRYDLTEDCVNGEVDITPVPDSHEGRYVSYEDYEDLYAVLCLLTDQVNLCELPDSLCEKLETLGLL